MIAKDKIDKETGKKAGFIDTKKHNFIIPPVGTQAYFFAKF